MSTLTRTRLDDFLADPLIEERRLELIDGEVCEKPMPTWGHGRRAGDLYAALNEVGFASVEARAVIARTRDFDASAPIPDVAFYRTEPPADSEWMRIPPHVAVEVLSPGQSRTEMRTKVELYRQFGVESVWVIDPERRVADIYEGGERRTLGEDDVITSSSAPGFAMQLRDVLDGRRRRAGSR